MHHCGYSSFYYDVAGVKLVTRDVSGWGRTPVALSDVRDIALHEASDLICGSRSFIPRGLGRGYGDCAVNGPGITAHTKALNGFFVKDQILDSGSGVSFDEILQSIIPQGLFLPVTPGTRFVTLGGVIAADVHGKNHHCDGSFGDFVEEIDLMIGDGSIVKISSTVNPKLFWATIGGMGLTGLILRARIRLTPIETSLISNTTSICKNIDDLMEEMIRVDGESRYSVAWLDTLAAGKKLGRSVLTHGDHAKAFELDGMKGSNNLDYASTQRLSFPKKMPVGLLNKLTIRSFNESWYQKARLSRKTDFVKINSFFYPLDGVRSWNYIYGKNGFIQHQFCVPDNASDLIPYVLGRLSKERIPSFLSVLKRFGSGNSGMLSFPTKGWTLAVDIPAGSENLGKVLDELDEKIVGSNGRIYLAKDARMNKIHLERMYPRLQEFREAKFEVDPHRVFESNLSRRLGL
jgi:decaprenylphospho-beta-D-ribofuranose 2-oxidase